MEVVIQKMIIIQDVEIVVKIHLEVKSFMPSFDFQFFDRS
jgi:hypothetical protein